MKIVELINTLKNEKIRLELNGERLLCYMPNDDYRMPAFLQQAIKANKSELIEFLQQLKQPSANQPQITKITRDPSASGYGLSSQQERLWFVDRLEQGESFTHNNCGTIEFDGKLDASLLEQCFNTVIARHESLRTRFISRGGQPLQAINEQATIELPIVQITSLAQVEQYAIAHAQHLFNLSSGQLIKLTLLKLGDLKHILLLNIHHIVSDGWSIKILFKELTALYQSLLEGQPNPLPELPIQYIDYAHWQQQRKEQGDFDHHLTYWQNQLTDMPKLLELATDHARPAVQDDRGSSVTFKLPDTLVERLNTLSVEQGVSLFMTLLSGFNVLLWRYTEQTDLLVGTPIANRNQAELEGLIGFFVNTLVLRTGIDEQDTVAALLQKVKTTTLSAYEHQHLPFEQLVNHLNPQRSLSYNPIFQVMFMLQNTQIGQLALPQLQSRLSQTDNHSAKFDISLELTEQPDGLFGRLEYATALFERSSIEQIVGHYQTLLEGMVYSPTTKICELPLLNATQQHYLLHTLNGPIVDNNNDLCIHQLFEQQAKQTPDHIAVIFESQQLSYQSLNEQANQLAHYLRAQGVKPETLVGLCIERSLEMVIAVLAILKAGGAYVPLDANYPQSRLDFMLEDCGITLLLSQKTLKLSGAAESLKTLWLDDVQLQQTLREQDSNDLPLIDGQSADNLAYVIYTSGSTGQPKGVMTEHRAVTSFVAPNQYVDIDEVNVVLGLSSIVFDGSVFDLFMPLSHGKTVVIAVADKVTNTEYLAQLINQHAIDTAFITTALFNQLCTDATDVLQQLKQLLFGGEKADVGAIRRFVEQASNSKLVHVYGPTETTVFATSSVLTANNFERAPIGRPLHNKTHYVLNGNHQLVPFGTVGELYIGGAGLARGYLNQPQLTAQTFIQNPFNDESTGDRLYKTGDLVRHLPSGELMFVSRADGQVKIRGLRIELGEIEHRLLQLPQVKSAVVLAREDQSQSSDFTDKRLVAYITTGSNLDEGELVDTVRQQLQATLPDYMVPPFFVVLGELPLTTNGKIDKKALPLPEGVVSSAPFVAPTTPTQIKLVQIWSDLLAVNADKLSCNANFFESGGHSLLTVRLVAQVRSQLNVELNVRTVFDTPVLSQLAAFIDKGTKSTSMAVGRIERASNRLPASFAQQRLWFIDQMEDGSSQYNMPGALRFKGEFDVTAIEQAFARIIERHEPLRTVFVDSEEGVQQIISDTVDFKLTRIDLTHLVGNEQQQSLQQLANSDAGQAFNLEQDLMLRSTFVSLNETHGVLLFNLHHIASDGLSMAILLEEFNQHYDAIVAQKPSPLTPLAIDYADYAQWQRNWLQGEVLEQHIDYWKTRLEGAPQVHSLVPDRLASSEAIPQGCHNSSHLSASLSAGLNALSLAHGATLFMTLQTAFALHLGRCSGESDIVMGTPIAGRGHEEVAPLIGLFLNNQVLRNQFADNPTFVELLERTRQDHLDAHEFNELPFEVLVDRLNPQRSLSHAPIFQILINMTPSQLPKVTFADNNISAELETLVDQQAIQNKYDITLYISESNEDSSIRFDWVYNGQLFSADTMAMMADEFSHLLTAVSEQPEQQVLNYPWRSAQQWQVPDSVVTGYSIVELFEQQVDKAPQQIALVVNEQAFSYQALNRRANQLAHHFRANYGIKLGSRVVIATDRSFDRIATIWAVLKLGAAYIPLTSELPSKRLDCILEDSSAGLIVTDMHSRDWVARLNVPKNTLMLDVDHASINSNFDSYFENIGNLAITANTIAHIIYTSGSTGRPKGVLGTHGATVNRIDWMLNRFAFADNEQAAHLTSMAFIRGVWELFVPLCGGVPLHLLSRDVVKDPARLLAQLSFKKITRMVTAPSLMRAILDDIQTKPTSLENLRYWFVSGEALTVDLAKQAHKVFTHTDFFNLYGSTEVLSDVLYTQVSPQETSSYVPLGKPISNVAVTVVDKQGNPVPHGVLGELVVTGKSVVAGYDGLEALSKSQFIATPAGRGYRTGDLVRVLADGAIGYVGRADHQIKIRGYRIELAEIEVQLTQLNCVNTAVVIAIDDADQSGQKRLVAYITSTNSQSQADLIRQVRDELRTTLPDYMIPPVFMVLDVLPLTPNGKVNRKALPAPESASSIGDYVAPVGETETTLVNIFSQLLKIDADNLSTTAHFFESGGHSLLSVRLVAQVRTLLGVELAIRDIFNAPVLSQLAAFISQHASKATRAQVTPIERASNRLATSFAQNRLWFIDQMDGSSSQYNIAGAMRFNGVFDEHIIEQAFARIIERHEPLRTVFTNTDEGTLQVIRESVEFKVNCSNLTSLDATSQGQIAQQQAVQQAIEINANHIFNLEQDVMLNIGIIRLSQSEGVMLFNVHHIAADGWSMGQLVKELGSQYHAILAGKPNPLPPLAITYADYAHWQREATDVQASQLNYWEKQLAELPQVHSLPLDRPRPKSAGYQGARVNFSADKQTLDGLKNLALSSNATVFMILHGAFSLLLSRHSNSNDIVMGVPMANRLQKELEPIIGFFVNTLVLRADCSGNPAFVDYLTQIKTTNLDAQANQDVPFEHLVDHLKPARSTAHSPLIQVMFSMNTIENTTLELPGLTVEPVERSHIVAKFELTLYATQTAESLDFGLEYNTDLFDGQTIERLGDHLVRLLGSIAANPQCPIGELALLSDDEQLSALHTLNDAQVEYPQDKCIHQLFEQRVELAPDAVALTFGPQQLSYQALNEKANRLAHYLSEQGVKADTLVGLCVERTPDLLIGLLAILKAGGAYVPLDPNYPQSRLDYVVEDSGIAFLLTQQSINATINTESLTTLYIDDIDLQQTLQAYSCDNLSAGEPANLAYVIYTSGSTGQPKGVMVEHHNVVRLLQATEADFAFGSKDVWTLFHSFAFDFSVWEIWGALAYGGRLVVVPSGMPQAYDAFYQLLIDEKVTVLNQTPSAFNQLNLLDAQQRGALSLRTVIFGGEALNLQQLSGWVERHGDASPQLINMYGITETTVHVTYRRIMARDIHENKGSLIGRPIGDLSLYLLNDQLGAVPFGAPGEIFVGGNGVARGYLNREDLTASRFIGNPHKPGERLYRTGDLGRFVMGLVPGGEIDYLGRIDDQVKIRGFRIELGEIEQQLLLLPQVQSAIVLAREDEPGHQRLVAYVTVNTGIDEINLRSQLQNILPEHMIPAFFVVLETLPLTANGKIDRKALPAPDSAALQGDYVAPTTDTEHKLVNIWCKLLKIDSDKLGITANFFESGGDSILSIQLVSRAAQVGVRFSVKQLFEFQTIEALATCADGQTSSQIIAPQGPVTGALSLLPIQQAFFADHADLHHFNQAALLVTPASFKASELYFLVEQLVQRHDALRLRFNVVDGECEREWTANHQPFDALMIEESIATETLAGNDFAALTPIAELYQTSLSLAEGPLFKLVYFSNESQQGRLLFIVHHLLVDGVSWRVLLEDVELLCNQLFVQNQSLSLSPKTSSYQQWGAFLNDYAQSDALLLERDYWVDVLAQEVAVLPSSGNGAFRKETTQFALDETTTTALLQQSGLAYRTQINELLLSALLLGFNCWSGASSIRIDLEGHGREALSESIDLSQTVGWFTSLYPLSLSVPTSASTMEIETVICSVKESYRAIPNQGIGFGLLKYLAKDETLANAPQSQIVFNYLGQFDQIISDDNYLKLGDESTGQAVSPNRSLQHDLSFNGSVVGGCLGFNLSFDAGQYDSESMADLANQVGSALNAIVSHCIEPDAGCLTPSDFPLALANNALLSMSQLSQWATDYPIDDIYPATPMQQGLLFHSKVDTSAYTTQMLMRLDDDLNSNDFCRAWQQVADRHSVLRTAFVENDQGTLQQLVLKTAQLSWFEHDISQLSEQQQLETIEQFRLQDKAKGFDITQAPLMRFNLWSLGNGGFQLLWSHHHALVDGWCLPLIFAEVVACYQALQSHKPVQLAKPKPYRDYIAWLVARDINAGEQYWCDTLSGFEAPTPLPERRDGKRGDGVQITQLTLSKGDTEQLALLARTCKTTANILVQGAWAYLLSVYAGAQSVVFGSTVSGRPPELAGVEQMVGLFINTLPVHVEIDRDSSLKSWLQKLHQAQVSGHDYGYLGLGEIQRLVGAKAGLFDSLMVFENYPSDEALGKKAEASGLNVTGVKGFEGTNYGLSLMVSMTDVLDFRLHSQRSRFSDEQPAQLLKHLHQVLKSMVVQCDGSVGELSLLGKDEKHELLHTFNDTHTDYPKDLCLHEQFEQHAELTPDNTALVFMRGDTRQQLSYQTLNERANQLAHHLRQQGVKPNTLVGICVERSLDMMIGVLAILKAGGAYVPLDPAYPQARLNYMVKDSGIRLLLSQTELQICNDFESDLETDTLTTVFIDDALNESTQNLPKLAGQSPSNLAYVIYTSGSTGQPKGVMVEHGGAVNLAQYQQDKFDVSANSRVLQFASLSFDAATWEWIMALLNGATLLVCNEEQKQSVPHLQDYLIEQAVTHATLPPALLALMNVDNDYALSHLIVAGESIDESLAKRWLATPTHLFNAYGPSETTVCASVAELSDTSGVHIGRAMNNTQLYVLDEQGKLLPKGAVGELHIGGAGLARGYLNRPELTAEQFIVNPLLAGQKDDNSSRLYKTGDLVCLRPSGDLVFVGRVDNQVKIRGFRVELGEIEHCLTQLPQLKTAVVLVREDELDHKQLVAYVVFNEEEQPDISALKTQLKSELPNHMVPALFVAMDALPLTVNGKIDKKVLPEPDGSQLMDVYVAPTTTSEIALATIWAMLLKIEVNHLSATANFFDCGGHSLLSVRLVGEVRTQMGVELAISDIFDTPDLAALALLIDNNGDKAVRESVVAIERNGNELPMSFAQQRLWFIDQMDQNSVQYNMPGALRFKGVFDAGIVEQAFARIIARHEPLRTVFIDNEAGVQQLIRANVAFELTTIDFTSLASDEQQIQVLSAARADASKAFNLSEDLMLRSTFIRLSDDEGVLLFNMHHIASDGWSMGLLVEEFWTQYQAIFAGSPDPFTPLAIQYADYAQWQQSFLFGVGLVGEEKALASQLTYWDKQLVDLVQVHSLPLDWARPKHQTFNGAQLSFSAPQATLTGLKQLALLNNATLFMVLHGALAVLLSRHSNIDDIVIGAPVANRLQKELAPIIGLFANTLVLRANCADNPSFIDFLEGIRTVNLDAQTNQDVPFEHLVERLNPTRSTAHSPLFQILLSMNNSDIEAFERADLSLTPLIDKENKRVAKFELTLNAVESGNGLALNFEYNTDLFDGITIERLAKHLLNLLNSIVSNPQNRIADLPMLGQDELHDLLQSALQGTNETSEDFPKGLVHELFERQAAPNPETIALTFGPAQLSYQALNQQANRLAHHLIKQGVKADTLVGLCVEPSLDMIVGLLAILKAGGAYVPLDPAYPKSRLDFMIQDSKLNLLIGHQSVHSLVDVGAVNTIWLDDANLQQTLLNYSDDDPVLGDSFTSDNLAYVIYTSGSTGQPKGVMVEHKSAVNFIHGFVQRLDITQRQNWLLLTTITFDIALFEWMGCFATGGRCSVASQQNQQDAFGLNQLIKAENIDVIQTTPSRWGQLMDSGLTGKTGLIALCGGEPLSAEVERRFAAFDWQVFNCYGPTEATVWSLINRVQADDATDTRLSLGTGLANYSHYVLGRNGELLPEGATGELYLGGDSLARGYLNQPEMSAQRFVQNPFSDDSNSRLYKTGDLVRFLRNGKLAFVGRNDAQVKLRGYRIELGEIEHQLSQLPQVNAAAVLVTPDQHLAAYVTGDVVVDDLREGLQTYLPEYMVPSFFMVLDELPLTLNGKVDKKALPSPDSSLLVANYVAPVTATQHCLVGIWSDLLNIDSDKLSTNANFFAVGGHSLLSVRMVGAVRTQLLVELSIREVFDAPDLSALAGVIDSVLEDKSSASQTLRPQVERVERTSQGLPTSFAQQRLWFIDQMDGGSVQYNMPSAMRIKGPFDVMAAQRAFARIIARHEPLRTVFADGPQGTQQLISADFDFTLETLDLTAQAVDAQEVAVQQAAKADATKAFDLTKDLMLRSTFIHLSEDEGVLLFNVHHIASDGWSMGLLVNEFSRQYEAIITDKTHPFAPLPVQYADYAHWQRTFLTVEVIDQQLGYWDQQLAELPQVHSLPLERTRPKVQTFNGARVNFDVDNNTLEPLKNIALANNATLFMVLHGAFSVLLSRHSNSHDIVVGTPVANRLQTELEPLIGFFVNTLVLRADCANNPSFVDFLAQLRQVNLDAQANQDVSFEHLVERIQPQRSTAHGPLFQILFTMDTNETTTPTLHNCSLSGLPSSSLSTKFELSLFATQTAQGLNFGFEYNSDLFDEQTIERLASHLRNLLQSIAANPQVGIGELPMLSDNEQQYLLQTLHSEQTVYQSSQPSQCIHHLFEQQATRVPDNIALTFGQQQLSYWLLNEKANRLAHYLIDQGVKADTLVGLSVERSADMVIGLLAILKAGGAYVPLDPNYPQSRLDYVIKDSGINIVLSHKQLNDEATLLRYPATNVVDIDGHTINSLAYVIYTSGSTGQPKGVLVEHHNVVRLFKATEADFGFDETDVWSLFHSYAFDFSVWEIWGALAYGGRLVVVPSGMTRAYDDFYQLLVDEKVTVLNQTPSAFNQLDIIDGDLKGALSLRFVVFGGEALTLSQLAGWVERRGDAQPQLVNMYGITETTVHVTHRRILAEDIQANKGSLIGRPIIDLSCYILNEQCSPVPIGVCGELFVGGNGVTRGYLNQPELTASRFIDNPYAPGQRLYRTGDLARFLPDGEIEYLGRIDNQVKIRGFRIELGEIEQQLAQLPEVNSAVVLAREDEPEQQQLVAYVTSTSITCASNAPDLSASLREQLQEALPSYMVPAFIVVLDDMPLTSNGKIDHKALPAPNSTLTQCDYVPPSTETEIQLTQIWAGLLKLSADKISADADFFDLGGHSILMMRLLNGIKTSFEVNLTLTQLFDVTRLNALASRIELSLVEGNSSEDSNSEQSVGFDDQIESFDDAEQALDDTGEADDFEEFEL